MNCSQLVRHLQTWALQGQMILVEGVQLQVDSSCSVNLSQLSAVECKPIVTSEPGNLLVPLVAGIGGGLLGIVLLTICCCVGYRLGRKRKSTSAPTRYVSASVGHALTKQFCVTP